MNKKIQSRLDKVWAKAQGNETEMEKLRELCGKYQVDFDAYIASKQPTAESPTAESPTAESPTAESPTAEEAPKAAVKEPSRRGLIIDMMSENIWDRASIAEVIAFTLTDPIYEDPKRNATAVTGTIGDLRSNNKADIKVCETTGRIVFKALPKPKK